MYTVLLRFTLMGWMRLGVPRVPLPFLACSTAVTRPEHIGAAAGEPAERGGAPALEPTYAAMRTFLTCAVAHRFGNPAIEPHAALADEAPGMSSDMPQVTAGAAFAAPAP